MLLANVGDAANPLLEDDADDVVCRVPAGRKTVELLEDFAGGSSGSASFSAFAGVSSNKVTSGSNLLKCC